MERGVQQHAVSAWTDHLYRAANVGVEYVCHVNYCTPITIVCQVFSGYNFSAMKILALAVLFAVIFLSPIPRQTSDKGGSSAEKPPNTTNASKNPSAPTPVIIQKDCTSGKFKNDPDCKPPENKESTVAVSKLPAANVTIQRNAERDVFDWIAYGFSIALAIAGIIGVCLAIATLRQMKGQREAMIAQWKTMQQQVKEMRLQVIEMRRQLRMSVDKERARIEIKALGLELQRVGEEFWNIKAAIEFRNVGAGRAYIRLGTGDLVIEGNEQPTDSYPSQLNIVDGFIDPTGNPTTESFYFFQPENQDVSEYARNICNGQFRVYITGFIEYETVGTRFHRDFNYGWTGHESPFSISSALMPNQLSPESDEDRVSFGFFSPNSAWMTGRSGDNEEYEMEPPKEKKKPKDPT